MGLILAAPRVLGEYARDRKLFPLETAVHKMTGMAATRLGLRDRGVVRVGAVADLVVFDPATVKDESTYPDPHRYPSGLPFVVVNGHVAVDGGRLVGRGAGRVLAPDRYARTLSRRLASAPRGEDVPPRGEDVREGALC